MCIAQQQFGFGRGNVLGILQRFFGNWPIYRVNSGRGTSRLITMLETNIQQTSLKDMRERVNVLRGYL